jgi:alpha-N-arabinofuranosidase
MTLDTNQPFNDAIPVSLRLDIDSAARNLPVTLANDGYWGMPVRPSTRYQASFYAKAASDFSGPITVSVTSDDGTTVYASATVPEISPDWKRYEVSLKTGGKIAPTTKARFVLSVEHRGTIWLSLVSLFPPTWKNQPNGFRQDLLQMLVDLNPKFLRLPGGNYLEGDTIATRFDWKKTLGPIEHRSGHAGPWGYRSTDGMGLAEFLIWCEDMKAEPVLAVYAGYSLKGAHVNPGPDLDPFVQDALDEIEYVTGPAGTKWGAERAKDGHPKPFPLHYVEIGNEDWFDNSGSYDARYAQFYSAIKAKYPQLKCISTVGNEQPGSKRVHSLKPDVVDEHYYQTVETFLSEVPARFDKYDRSGPEIFVGEWAAHETSFPPWDKRSQNEPPTPNMKAAIGDAAWMAGMERNSDFVKMNCYAPLLVNVHGRQWRPDLIGYDGLRVYGSPSYYAIKMFSCNVGDEILHASLDSTNIIYSVTRDAKHGILFIKLVNPDSAPQTVNLDISGIRSIKSTGAAITLAAPPDATNSIDDPGRITPVVSKLPDVKPAFSYPLPPTSIVVLKLTTR